MLIFIFALSGALESYTMERSRKDISSLMERSRKRPFALRRRDGIGIHQQAGDRRSDSGKAGRAYSGRRQNLSRHLLRQPGFDWESVPVDKSVGDEVFTGTLNGKAYCTLRLPSESTLFAKIIKLVEEAENEVPESRRFIKRFESIYARVVVIATVALIVLATLVLDGIGILPSIKRWCFS